MHFDSKGNVYMQKNILRNFDGAVRPRFRDIKGAESAPSMSYVEFERPCQIGLSQILKLDKQKWS